MGNEALVKLGLERHALILTNNRLHRERSSKRSLQVAFKELVEENQFNVDRADEWQKAYYQASAGRATWRGITITFGVAGLAYAGVRALRR